MKAVILINVQSLDSVLASGKLGKLLDNKPKRYYSVVAIVLNGNKEQFRLSVLNLNWSFELG